MSKIARIAERLKIPKNEGSLKLNLEVRKGRIREREEHVCTDCVYSRRFCFIFRNLGSNCQEDRVRRSFRHLLNKESGFRGMSRRNFGRTSITVEASILKNVTIRSDPVRQRTQKLERARFLIRIPLL
jgi:hypothetical protein